MKTQCLLLYLALACLTNGCAFGQLISSNKWTATIKVVGEDSAPVVGAEVSVSYNIQPPQPDPNQKQYGEVKGLTDTNGILIASHTDKSLGLGVNVTKDGYYTSHTGYQFYFDDKRRNPTFTLTLKKIGKPIAMYARKVQIEIPETNKPIGFDLAESDWVSPYGKGKQADFIFQADRRWVSRKDFDCTTKLTFSKAGDGLIPISIPLDQGSELRMSAIAPTNGYLPEISKSLSHTPADGWKDDEREGNKEENYYFRVRTKIDDRGNIVSAHYGKIYEDFALDPINSKTTWILFTYYFNSTPNDRNVEFNPKKNLIKDLKPLEEVKEP
jgi:hypothetical protein